MYMDSFYEGVFLSKISKKMRYEDGKATEIQQTTDNGIPVWTLLVAIPNGDFVEPVRVKVASSVEPEEKRKVRFSGVSVNAYGRSDLYFSAETFEYVGDDDDRLIEEMLGDGNEK